MPVSKKKEKPNFLAPFEFHGIELTTKGNQAKGDCPFCLKEGHFFVKVDTGQWDCKVCGMHGNIYTFLTLLHSHYQESTTPADLKQIGDLRKLPALTFERNEIAYDGSRYLFPIRNGSASLVGLRVWKGERGTGVFSTSGTKQHLYRGNLLHEKPKADILLCEGEFDTLAADTLINHLKLDAIAIGVPGCSSFQDEWTEKFRGRKVTLLFDNDDAGKKGTIKTALALLKVGCTVSAICWPDDLPQGYDLNDFVSERMKRPAYAWKHLQKLIHPFRKPLAGDSSTIFLPEIAGENLDDTPDPYALSAGYNIRQRKGKPPAFVTLVKEYKKYLHWEKSMEDALAVMLAIVFSARINGDPLWVFLVGPPGAGKSLMLRSFEHARDYTVFESTLKPTTFISGFSDGSKQDFSILARIPKRALLVKDFTLIHKQPPPVQEALYGWLRDAYDGKVDIQHGNQRDKRIYEDCYFSMIAGVTDVIHSHNQTDLGERFLKCEFIRGSHDSAKHVATAMDIANDKDMEQLKVGEEKIRELVADFLDREITSKNVPKAPKWATDRICNLAQVAACLRSIVPRSGREKEISYRPRPELATRLGKQLLRLARFLCVVFNTETVDDKIYRIVEQIALDTCYGWHLDLIKVFIDNRDNTLTADEIADKAIISRSSLGRRLDDLMELHVVKKTKGKDLTGRKIHKATQFYCLSPHILKLWDKAKVGEHNET